MPKIPFNPEQAVGNMVGEGAFTEAGKNIQVFGNQMMKTGEVVGDTVALYERRQKIARIASQEFQVKTEMYKDAADIDEQTEKMPYGLVEDFVKGKQGELRDKYKEIAKDPDAWNRVQPIIEHGFTTQVIGARHKARKGEIAEERYNYFASVETYSEWLSKSDPEESKRVIQEFSDYTRQMALTGVIDAHVGQDQIKTLKVQGDWKKLRKDIEANEPDDMRIILSDYQEKYPNLTDDHYFRALGLIERKEREIEKEQLVIKKEQYNTGAKEAFDRWQLWNQGKRGPDKTGFETWLEDARTKDIISEKTYESYTRGIEREKDRKSTQAVVATLGHFQTYQNILGGIKDGTYELEDVSNMTANLPKNMRNELMKLAAGGRPEDKAKAKGLQYLLKKAKENELDVDNVQDLKDEYEMRTSGAKVTDMMDVAKEMAGDLEDNSLAAQIKRRQEAKGKTPGIVSKIANMFGGGEKGKANAEEVKGAKTPEEVTREELAKKGITDKTLQDAWIEKYKAAGMFKK